VLDISDAATEQLSLVSATLQLGLEFREMHEHHIRDYLIENIKLLSPKLNFVDKEFQIEPIDGSRGFIDILAEAAGKYVIVEIKRSDQSARSTTNEISKYVEGLKRKLSLNNDDIQVIVVSTHWRELTVPYAYMAQRLGIPCDGYLIEWNDGAVVKSTKVEVPKLVGMRLFSPIHSMYMYHNYSNLEKGIKSVEEAFSTLSIEDYVTIILCAPPGYNERVAEANRAMAAALGQPPSLFDGLDEHYEYSLYIVFLRKDVETYRKILSRDQEILEYVDSEATEDITEDKAFLLYEDSIRNMKPYPYADWIEVAYAAKFTNQVIGEEGWIVEEIKRYGTLESNILLSDESIIDEISGNQGVAKGRVQSHASIDNHASLTRLESEVCRCLSNDNITWREQLLYVIRSFRSSREISGCEVILSLLSPNNFLLSLFNQIRDLGNSYLPHFQIDVVDQYDASKQIYVGRIVWSGTAPNLDELISDHFEGNIFRLVESMGWGGFLSNDVDIMKDLGLSYATFLIQADEPGDVVSAKQLKDFAFVEDMAAFYSFQRFLNEHKEFVGQLAERMNYYLKGCWFTSSPEDPYFDDN
jgi:hypothetical protein